MYFNHKTRQTYEHAISRSFNYIRQNIVILAPVKDEHYVLTPKPAIRAILLLFGPKKVKSADKLITFAAQEPGI